MEVIPSGMSGSLPAAGTPATAATTPVTCENTGHEAALIEIEVVTHHQGQKP
jgi:hypothetical protein